MNRDIIHNDTIDAIINRRTTREYKDMQITDKELDTLLCAAMWAPSGRNSQPCHVRALQDREALKEINIDFKNLVGWDTPAYTRWDTNPVYQNAPTVLFIYAEDNAQMSAGIMAENICIAAEAIGLGSCMIGSIGSLMDAHEGEKWKEKMNIPKHWHFLLCVAVGYKDEIAPVKPRDESKFEIIKKIEN